MATFKHTGASLWLPGHVCNFNGNRPPILFFCFRSIWGKKPKVHFTLRQMKRDMSVFLGSVGLGGWPQPLRVDCSEDGPACPLTEQGQARSCQASSSLRVRQPRRRCFLTCRSGSTSLTAQQSALSTGSNRHRQEGPANHSFCGRRGRQALGIPPGARRPSSPLVTAASCRGELPGKGRNMPRITQPQAVGEVETLSP